MITYLAMALAMGQAAPPNIVVVFSDDHARAALSAYGSKLIQTPGLDRIAKEGVRFDRHITGNPLCAPSRASLLTGKHSHANGHKDNTTSFDPNQPTFPKMLQKAGYETAVVGKWHLVSNPTGFDFWEVLPGQGAYYNPEFITPAGRLRRQGYSTEIITERALEWLRQPRSKPFFLLVGHKAPHRYWAPGPNEYDLFKDEVFPEPPTLRTDYATLASGAKKALMRVDKHLRIKNDLLVDFPPPGLNADQTERWKAAFDGQDSEYRARLERTGDLLGTNYQRYLQNYLRCVAAVDKSVAALMDELDRKGLTQNTVFVYASDQGFFLGENGWYDKRWFYEPSAGTPLLVRAPGGQPGVVADVTSNVDLAPTILEWARVPVPADMHGKSLGSLLRGGKETRPAAYGHFYESDDPDHKVPKWVGVTTARHKIVYYYELGEWELFDLHADPLERRNLWLSGPVGLKREMMRLLQMRQRELGEEQTVRSRVDAAIRAAW